MAFNGSGSYSPPGASFPAVASTLIESAKYNAVINDIATALSTCLTKDGQQTVTANIPFAGFKLTGVGAATARTDAATLASIQDGTGVYVGTVGGTANAITLTPSPAITAYAAGQSFWFKAASTNTGATTIAISGLGTIAAQERGVACVGGEIIANNWYRINLDTASTCQLQAVVSGPPFLDSNAIVRGSADGTKQVRFEVDGLTTATTRVLTVQDSNDTLVGRATTDTLTNKTLTSPSIGGTVSGSATYSSPALSGTVTGSATIGGTIVVPLARMQRTETVTTYSSVSVSNGGNEQLATADLGTVNTGDRVVVHAYFTTNGTDANQNVITIAKSSGTATIAPATLSSIFPANSSTGGTLAGVIRVTGGGTLVIKANGNRTGGIALNYTGELMGLVLNNG